MEKEEKERLTALSNAITKKREVQHEIRDLLQKFQDETGLFVEHVHVGHIRVLGGKFSIGEVHVTARLADRA